MKIRFRLMTYNVHRCVGLDNRLNVGRVARVIAAYEPDIVALQELDVRRARTRHVDQAHAIAQRLEMKYCFHPAMQVKEEQYGNAVLTRFPLELCGARVLPGLLGRRLEPRGALWVRIDVGGVEVQLINTHLGLRARERMAQVETLADWLAHPQCRAPRILCGDLNASPRSPVCRRLGTVLRDVAETSRLAHRTWISCYPLRRIDHVFVERSVDVASVATAREPLARMASDHLPLLADLVLDPRSATG